MHPLSTGMELRSASRPAVCQLGERQPVSAALDALASGCSGEGGGTAGVYEGYSESLLEALDYSPDLSQRILPELRLAVQAGADDASAAVTAGEDLGSFAVGMLELGGGRPLPGLS